MAHQNITSLSLKLTWLWAPVMLQTHYRKQKQNQVSFILNVQQNCHVICQFIANTTLTGLWASVVLQTLFGIQKTSNQMFLLLKCSMKNVASLLQT